MLPQFHTTAPIVSDPGHKIIMYNEYYIFLQTWTEKYAFSVTYGCIKFNFNVLMTTQFYSNGFITTHNF
jgi:hypothetical protein